MRRRIPEASWQVRSVFDGTPSAEWLDGVDGFVIGGSGSLSVLDDEVKVWRPGLRRLLDAALDNDTPGLCICFGHQFLAEHLGSRVHTDEARKEAGTIEVDVVDRQDSLFARLGAPHRAHAGHSDHVERVPEGARLLARTERSPVQAFRVGQLLSVQFHPDLTASEARQRYEYAFGDGPEVQRAMAAFDESHDETNVRLMHEWALEAFPR